MKVSSRAFTLFELLVIVAIVTVLAAALFPVIAQANTSALRQARIAKISALGTGASLYAYDSDGVYPCVGSPSINFAWSPAVNPSVDAAGNPWNGWGLKMAPYLENNNSFLSPLYPRAGQFTGECSNASGASISNDYSMNWMLGRDGSYGNPLNLGDSYAWAPDGSQRFDRPARLADVYSPANTVLFSPSAASSASFTDWGCLFTTLQASDFSNRLSSAGFSSTGTQIAFADLHVKPFLTRTELMSDDRLSRSFQGKTGPWAVFHLRSRGVWMQPTMPDSTMGFSNTSADGSQIGDL